MASPDCLCGTEFPGKQTCTTKVPEPPPQTVSSQEFPGVVLPWGRNSFPASHQQPPSGLGLYQRCSLRSRRQSQIIPCSPGHGAGAAPSPSARGARPAPPAGLPALQRPYSPCWNSQLPGLLPGSGRGCSLGRTAAFLGFWGTPHTPRQEAPFCAPLHCSWRLLPR